LFGPGLRAAGKIAAATGAKLFAPYPFARLERGAGLPAVERLHYILEQARDQLSSFDQVLLVGSPAPVSYFAYPGKTSAVIGAGKAVHTLAEPHEDIVFALESLAGMLPSAGAHLSMTAGNRPAPPVGEITLANLAVAIGALLPENAVVVDESMTSGRGIMAATAHAPPHDWLANTGGSIGIALPLALGAAIAAPDRPVLCLTADGSAMYTLQALWSIAREGAKVTTVVFSNREYAVLKREFSYLEIGSPGARAQDLFDIGRPDLDWVQLSRGLGVPATRVDSLDSFCHALSRGFESAGPSLIEVSL
jgi:acetolactate synthase-1/2/3 large subunit